MKASVIVMLFAIVFLCGLLVGSRAWRPSPVPIPAAANNNQPCDPAYYRRKVSQFAALGRTRPIVFYGDSRLDDLEWADLLGRSDISNRGVGCDTVTGAVQRLPQSVKNPVSFCIIQVGINDLAQGTSLAKITADYDKLLFSLQPEVQKTIVTSIIYVSSGHSSLNQRVAEANAQLKPLAARHKAAWLDLNAVLCPGGLLPDRYSTDGLHLNGEAYKVIGKILRTSVLPKQAG